MVTNHGSKDIGTATKVSIELDDLYFAATFIKAAPGAAVQISLKNNGTVALPASGALAFYCSIHRGSGMQGAFAVSASGDY